MYMTIIACPVIWILSFLGFLLGTSKLSESIKSPLLFLLLCKLEEFLIFVFELTIIARLTWYWLVYELISHLVWLIAHKNIWPVIPIIILIDLLYSETINCRHANGFSRLLGNESTPLFDDALFSTFMKPRSYLFIEYFLKVTFDIFVVGGMIKLVASQYMAVSNINTPWLISRVIATILDSQSYVLYAVWSGFYCTGTWFWYHECLADDELRLELTKLFRG